MRAAKAGRRVVQGAPKSISWGRCFRTVHGLGGASTSLAMRGLGETGVNAGGAAIAFCFGYGIGTELVDPVLHKADPEIFQEE